MMKSSLRIWIIALILCWLTPLQAEAYTIMLDIDLDDDPNTINLHTTERFATMRVVLQPTEPNESLTEFFFSIGSHCYIVVPELSTMVVNFNLLGGIIDDIPGLEGEYIYIPGNPCTPGYESDSSYRSCEVYATNGPFLLDEPIFLDTFYVERAEEGVWDWLAEFVPIHAFVYSDTYSGISSTAWLDLDWMDSPGPWAGVADISRGVAWADFNDDLRPDLYVANYGTANRLYQNMGDGSFADVTEGPLGDTGLGRGAFWADANGSGTHDLYLINNGPNVLLSNLGWTNYFEDATSEWLGGFDDTAGMAWGDFDLDGLPDIYLSNYGTSNILLHNQGGMSFIPVTPYHMSAIANSRGVAWADYDNDGDPDLLVSTSDEGIHLFRNDGAGDFTEVTAGDLIISGDFRGCAWGDYDNDEDFDLYVTRYDGANVLMRNDGGDLFTNVTDEDPGGELGDPGPGLSVAWVDFDNNRWLDLYVVNDGEPNVMLRHGTSNPVSFDDVTQPIIDSSAPGGGAAWADFDLDGDLDVFLAADGQPSQLISNVKPNNYDYNWLHVDPLGGHDDILLPSTVIGSRLRLVSGGLVQTREVSGGDGYQAQNSLVVEFGLGSYDMVDTLEVWYPWGGSYRAIQFPANQIIWCNQASSVPAEDPVPAYCRLYPSVPNPFNPSTRLAFTLSGTRQLDLAIHAVDGSCVRRFPAEPYPPGNHEITWDGRDETGRALPSGVYIFRIKARDFEATQRMTLVR